MAAYVVSEVEVLNDDAASSYKDLASAAVAACGGRYLARAAEAFVAEGRPAQGRIVIVEFPSMERAREWYVSPEYAKALAFRDTALRRRLVFADGISG